MKKLTYVVIGAGGRGSAYMRHANTHGNMELVAIADPMDRRRNAARDLYNLPEERCYHHWDELFAQGKIADCAMICTQDQLHLEPALKAIEQGYHLLLEKPVAPNPEDCMKICEAAEKKGVHVLVCHVLRYTPFWRMVKKIIDEGKLGRIMSIVHVEGVGNIHQSHSFVRGDWRNSNTSAPMLLAKSCHDIDLLQWLLDSRCTKVQSFGRLSYFTKENCPEGAPERCIDGCPHGMTCAYNAVKIYRENREKDWYARRAAHRHSTPSVEDMEEVLLHTDYGKCVFQSDNNVVDHQVVNLEYENGETVSFTMAAFNKGGRKIQIMGTKGELISTDSDTIQLYTFCDEDPNSETFGQPRTDIIKTSEANIDQTIAGGHGGGDSGIICDFYKLVADGTATRSVSTIRTSVLNHMTVFAAEESRNAGGQVVDVEEFVQNAT